MKQIVSAKLRKNLEDELEIIIDNKYMISFDYFNNYILSSLEDELISTFEVEYIGEEQCN